MPGTLLQSASDHLRSGRTREAIQDCETLLAVDPKNAAAVHTLGLARYRDGEVALALELLQRSIHLDSHVPDFHNNLGCVFDQLGRLTDAESCFRRAIALKPGFLPARRNIAASLEQQGRLVEALEKLDEILTIDPAFGDAHAGRASVLQGLYRFTEALEAFRLAAKLRPDHLFARRGIVSCLDALGRLDELIGTARETVALFPASASDHSDLIQILHYDANTSPVQLLEEARRWDAKHAVSAGESFTEHANEPTGWRRLRIGYSSPDFRDHPLGRLFMPVLSSHDRQAFEIFCYSDVPRPDRWTSQLQSLSDHWHDTSRVSDGDLAKRINADRIDILVELAGHFPRNRLRMLSWRPAPVQISALAYMGTTGVRSVAYRITDCHSDPQGVTDHQSSEELIRLPQCAFCYAPPDDAADVAPLPAGVNGFVTFASFNRLCKMTDPVLAAWAKILAQTGNSRLALPASAIEHATFIERCEHFGISRTRLDLIGRSDRTNYFRACSRVDIALDPFPFNGSITTCDMLWMGVPVITLAGNSFASRRGVSHLRNVGMDELIAASTKEYVGKAVSLASDRARLSEMRQSLRLRMAESPLTDRLLFTRNLETAYRAVWARWCAEAMGIG